jgi:hypothetical protein
VCGVTLAIVLLAGCVSSQAGALNRDVADYNQRLLAFQRDYQAAMTDLQYLRRAPGFTSLLTKGVDEVGRAKAAGRPYRSLDELQPILLPQLTDDERAAMPGAKAWITRTGAILTRGQALAAERLELERRQGELQVTAMRQAELYRGLDAALQTLSTLALVNALR